MEAVRGVVAGRLGWWLIRYLKVVLRAFRSMMQLGCFI